jgi:hypothetical protein
VRDNDIRERLLQQKGEVNFQKVVDSALAIKTSKLENKQITSPVHRQFTAHISPRHNSLPAQFIAGTIHRRHNSSPAQFIVGTIHRGTIHRAHFSAYYPPRINKKSDR